MIYTTEINDIITYSAQYKNSIADARKYSKIKVYEKGDGSLSSNTAGCDPKIKVNKSVHTYVCVCTNTLIYIYVYM